jgi:hypothetical protein
MSVVFGPRTPANKLVLTKGQTLASLIGSTKLDDVGLYNWGTKDKAEISRALVELVGCERLDEADPLKSVLDPALGTGGAIHLPEPWKPDEKPLALEKTHTIKLKRRLPVPGVAITKLSAAFIPKTGSCAIECRLEGPAARADKTDVEVHATAYYEVKDLPRDSTKATGADNPLERNEIPCGTDQKGDTHIWQTHKSGAVPSAWNVAWDGESTAKHGVLKPPSSGKAYINASCAPYTVLVRSYKDGKDSQARITFKRPLYPRWKIGSGGARTLDPGSLAVEWEIKDDNAKLVLGHLLIVDKDDNVVLRTALDGPKLKAGKLDLSPLWPASTIKRESMPYRAQLQAHSGPDEDDGLAIAIMQTQVRAYDYKKVQLIAFNVRPGSSYMGDVDDEADITARCGAMIEAVQKAYPQADAGTDVLKLFMAPEFYFRGPAGAYPVDRIETIIPKLRAESDKPEYADWMFVFGSAIGYHRHDDAGAPIVHADPKHKVAITKAAATDVTVVLDKKAAIPQKGWRLAQGSVKAAITGVSEVVAGSEYQLTFAAGPVFTVNDADVFVPLMALLETDPASSGPATRIRVEGRIFCRIPPATTVGGKRWKVRQGLKSAEVTTCTLVPTTRDQYWLALDPPTAFSVGAPLVLVEPAATEVINVALVQKGWPAPHMGDGSLRHVAIYKEKVSPIDFTNTVMDWHKADASHRLITIHGTTSRPVIPTEGASDLGGGRPNQDRPKDSNVGSEINETGLGGGVVFTMDGITFGLEVCLDHAKNRLSQFYAGTTKRAGDPKIQLHLIPSYGMTIGGGDVCCPAPKGIVFNVDGQSCQSVARLHDGTYSCDDHPDMIGSLGDFCTKIRNDYFCGLCGWFVSNKGGKCDVHPAEVLNQWSSCGSPRYYGCSSSFKCDALTNPCSHPGAAAQYHCLNCKAWPLVGVSCGCASPQPVAVLCTETKMFKGACPTCGRSDRKCNRALRKLGSPLPFTNAGNVPKSGGNTHFQRAGHVLIYDVQVLVPPDVV